ncbi:MAG: M55 family metallopeptidase [Clostridioides sp.]|jgi:D-amino peptidase|nr:M55 family metallopeptidase [Clostridioides sp.]
MKIYLSADIEGTCGINHWNETDPKKHDHVYFADQMSKEVAVACEGAEEVGADEILVKDAHYTARNIKLNLLPKSAKLFRGWSKDPLVMMSGIDETYDACLFTGYHNGAGLEGNPLCHTMDTMFSYIKINGMIATEFVISAYICAYYGVPVAFLSGDKALCEGAKKFLPNIVTVAVNEGCGAEGTISIHPDLAIERIKAGVKEALSGDLSRHLLELPEHFEVEMRYKERTPAYKASFYPGMKMIDPNTVVFKTDDYYEVMRMMLFV